MAEEEKATDEMESPILVSDFDSLVYMLSKVNVEYDVTENDNELTIGISVEDDMDFDHIVFEFDPESGDLDQIW